MPIASLPVRARPGPLGADPPLHRRSYIPAFDGLRAVLVGGVLLYHLSGARLATATGEVAVISFFSLSGFLITFLLADEQRRNGRIDLRAFFRRRSLRLFPALGLLLLVWVVVAVAFRDQPWTTSVPGGGAGSHIAMPTIAETAGAALFYVTNWINALLPQVDLWVGYSPLGHLWSLAVEEQFYLLWGPAMVLLARRRHAGLWMALLAAGFLVEPALLYHLGTNRVYFGTDTRMGALLAGAALGWWWRAGALARLERSLVTPVIGALCAAGLLVAGAGFRHPDIAWEWVGGIVAASVASAGLVLAVANSEGRRGPLRLLSHPVAIWLGQRSYAIYLWGYVFNTWFRSLGAACPPMVLACTLAMAELSHRFVEQPLRALGRRRREAPAPARVVRPAPVPAPVPALAPELVLADG